MLRLFNTRVFTILLYINKITNILSILYSENISHNFITRVVPYILLMVHYYRAIRFKYYVIINLIFSINKCFRNKFINFCNIYINFHTFTHGIYITNLVTIITFIALCYMFIIIIIK